MKVLTEKEAEKFLEKEGFSIAEGFFIKNKSQFEKNDFNGKFAAKASGKKIVHKKNIGGVILGISSTEDATKALDRLMKIKGAEEVFFQRQLSGKEFLLGIKKTPEFGHVVVYGVGGSGVEEKKDFSFRVCPFDSDDADKMIKETSIGRRSDSEDKILLKKEIMKFCKLAEKFPGIKELDINPLMINGGRAYVVDARVDFE